MITVFQDLKYFYFEDARSIAYDRDDLLLDFIERGSFHVSGLNDDITPTIVFSILAFGYKKTLRICREIEIKKGKTKYKDVVFRLGLEFHKYMNEQKSA